MVTFQDLQLYAIAVNVWDIFYLFKNLFTVREGISLYLRILGFVNSLRAVMCLYQLTCQWGHGRVRAVTCYNQLIRKKIEMVTRNRRSVIHTTSLPLHTVLSASRIYVSTTGSRSCVPSLLLDQHHPTDVQSPLLSLGNYYL